MDSEEFKKKFSAAIEMVIDAAVNLRKTFTEEELNIFLGTSVYTMDQPENKDLVLPTVVASVVNMALLLNDDMVTGAKTSENAVEAGFEKVKKNGDLYA